MINSKEGGQKKKKKLLSEVIVELTIIPKPKWAQCYKLLLFFVFFGWGNVNLLANISMYLLF